jgi:hypothetical protein
VRTPGTGQLEPLRYFEAHLHDGGDACYEWPFHCNANGYAPLTIDGRRTLVHVLACERTHGPRPKGLEVCHSCGNKTCFNPAHLRWDTHQSNMRDRARMGRTRRGEQHGRSKLTWKYVEEIRWSYAHGVASQQTLANIYGVSQNSISKIILNRTWIKV